MKTLRLSQPISGGALEEIRERLPYVCPEIDPLSLEAGGASSLRFQVRRGKRPYSVARLRALAEEIQRSYRAITPIRLFERNGRPGPHEGSLKEMQRRGFVRVTGPGHVALRGPVLRAARYFDDLFLQWGESLGAEEQEYSSLIPLKTLVQAGYPQSFPQHLTLACHVEGGVENLNRFAADPDVDGASIRTTDQALSPAVCYHCYPAWAGRTLEGGPVIVTARGRCFRNEAGHLKPMERLWDFTMREIVFVGSHEQVESVRQTMIARGRELLEQLDLCGTIESATDPFFTEASSGKRLLQGIQALKFELRLRIDDHSIAAASFNHHGTFFGERFQIDRKEAGRANTGCVAFGIERWAYAFCCQHGLDEAQWPESLTRQERGN